MLGQPRHREGAAVSTYMVGDVQAADADSSLVSQPRPMLFRFPDLPAYLSGPLALGARRVGLRRYEGLLIMTANVRLPLLPSIGSFLAPALFRRANNRLGNLGCLHLIQRGRHVPVQSA